MHGKGWQMVPDKWNQRQAHARHVVKKRDPVLLETIACTNRRMPCLETLSWKGCHIGWSSPGRDPVEGPVKTIIAPFA